VLEVLDSGIFPRSESLDTTLQRLLIFTFIALCPIQDLILRGTPLTAVAGSSPSSVPLLFIIFLGYCPLGCLREISRPAGWCYCGIICTCAHDLRRRAIWDDFLWSNFNPRMAWQFMIRSLSSVE
jgi:hypothetical protein